MTNQNGRFGIHGGQYIPETLMNAVIELEEAYNYYKTTRNLTGTYGIIKRICGETVKTLFCTEDDKRSGRGEDLSET